MTAMTMIDQSMILGDENDKSVLLEHFHKWMFAIENGSDSIVGLDACDNYQKWRKRFGEMVLANRMIGEIGLE